MRKNIGDPINIRVEINNMIDNIPSWASLDDILFIFYTNEYKQEIIFSLSGAQNTQQVSIISDKVLTFKLRKEDTVTFTEDMLMLKVIVDPIDAITERLTYKKVFTGITMNKNN